MKYTKKQRNEIYRKALELFYGYKRRRKHAGILSAILEVVKDISSLVFELPECEMFCKDTGFDVRPFDYDSRENALLLMIEMTNP